MRVDKRVNDRKDGWWQLLKDRSSEVAGSEVVEKNLRRISKLEILRRLKKNTTYCCVH